MKHASKKRRPRLDIVGTPVTLMQGHHEGWIAAIDGEQVLVDYASNAHGALPARTTLDVASLRAARAAAIDSRCLVLLVFQQERSDQPVIVGLLHPAPRKAVEALVDGKRVVIAAQDEIVLRCGEASITLRGNGRVVIRGTYVETRSKGVNRVRGGSVQIN